LPGGAPKKRPRPATGGSVGCAAAGPLADQVSVVFGLCCLPCLHRAPNGGGGRLVQPAVPPARQQASSLRCRPRAPGVHLGGRARPVTDAQRPPPTPVRRLVSLRGVRVVVRGGWAAARTVARAAARVEMILPQVHLRNKNVHVGNDDCTNPAEVSDRQPKQALQQGISAPFSSLLAPVSRGSD